MLTIWTLQYEKDLAKDMHGEYSVLQQPSANTTSQGKVTLTEKERDRKETIGKRKGTKGQNERERGKHENKRK